MISQDFVSKYTAQQAGNSSALGFAAKVDDFAASTVVDVGTALFNSVVTLPKLFGINTDEYRVETYDLLKNVNEDWANYYNENKDLVETASFIAGILLPAGVAFKGMKALQAGKLGFYPTALSDVTQTQRITQLTKMLELGKKGTTDYRNLRWKILATNAGQETMQAAAAELAVIASLNQHAWMEDYLKDPVSNFALSLGIGGVLGSSIGQLLIRKQLRSELGAITSSATEKVISNLVDIPLGISDVDKVQRFTLNAKTLRDIAADEAQTPLTRQIADYFATTWEGQAGKLEQNTVFGPGLRASKQRELLEQTRGIMLSDAAFGANRVDLFTYDPKESFKRTKHSGVLTQTQTATDTIADLTEPSVPLGFTRLYRAERRKEALTAAGRKEITEGFVDGIPAGSWFVKDINELPFRNPGYYDASGVTYIDVPTSQVENYNFMKHPVMKDKQHHSTFEKEYVIPVELHSKVKTLRIGDDSIRKAILVNKLSRPMKYSLTVTESLKTFTPEWAKLMREDFSILYSPYHKAWIPREDIASYLRAVDTGKTTWERINVYKPNPDAFTEFGVRGVPTAAADSYWINTLGTVASVNLEPSVYMMQGDLGLQNAWISRLSALASEGKPIPKLFLIDESLGAQTVSEMRKKATQVTLQELEENLAAQKQTQIRALMNSGASLQEIGIRLNMKTSAVEQHLLEGKELMTNLGTNVEGWRLYTNPAAIDTEYMAQTTRALSFTTNGHRLASLAFRNADMSAKLDAKFIKQQNREMMADIIASSGSVIAKDFYQTLNKDNAIWDVFEQQLSNVVNEKSGSFFFTSADFASRDMGDIGRIATIKGQEFFGIANATSQRLLTNLSTKLRAQTLTQVGINEFNKIINLLQSTSGYRNIDETGLLYRLVEQEPGVFIKEAIRDQFGQALEMSPSMRDFLIEMRDVSRELWSFKNAINKIQGFKDLNDIGLWIPAFNPTNKFLSYVIDTQASTAEGRVKLLIGKSPEDLAKLEQDWLAKNPANDRFKLITKAQQEDYNFWQMRTDPTEMDFADISKFHSGASASAVDIFDDTFAATMIENLHNRVIFYGRKMQEMYLDDIMSTLDNMSALNQKYFANQPTLLRAVGLSQREDAARSIKNTILGNNNLAQHSTWQTINNGFASMVEFGSRKIQDLYRGFFEFDEKTGLLKKSDYVKFSKELESIGIKNPFKDFNDYLAYKEEATEKSRYTLTDITNDAANEPIKLRGDKLFNINVDGKYAGDILVNYNTDTKTIYVENVQAEASGGANSLGLKAIKEIGIKLRSHFPGAQKIAGQRISGVRGQVLENRIGLGDDEHLRAGIDILDYADVTTARLPRNSASFSAKQTAGTMLENTVIQEAARRHGVPYSTAEQIIAAGNSILATAALRILETGHALVTAISWPIIMAPEFFRKMPKTYLGNALGEGIEVPFPARAIYDGIRFRNSDAAKPLIERWIREGFGESIVSEATRLNQLIATGGKGAITEINKILNSDLIKTLSKPSDFAEKETRLWALSIGFQMARRMYPGISDTGADLFAKEFMTRTIGNYYSAQRPVMFQGTFGVAIGLFQTYMLTWAQQAFRSIENKQFKALASQMLAQSGMFGMNSLPLYDVFSKTIGEHFSDKHYDLTTGTYRALPDPMSEFIVYGLPSSLGVGLYTRGDMQPRIPFTQDNVLDTIAAINATRQFVAASSHTIGKVMSANGFGDKFRGLLEGIAMQSLSRPAARIIETIPLPDGQGGFRAVGAISREGNTIATDAEIWTGPGLLSRLLASRSTEEQIKREADYLNSFYGAVDYRHRKRATETLKSSIRSGTLNQDTLEEVAAEYLRTGTATGWKAALNEALATSEGGIDYKLGKRLRPDSPLMKMIDETY